MKYVVGGICRTTGLITTRQIDAADPVAAESMASAGMIVFDVEPAAGQQPPAPAGPASAATLSPLGDAARRLAFALSILILAGLFVWSARQSVPPAQPLIGSAARPVIALPSHVAATHPALPPFARAAGPRVVPATPVTLSR